MIQQI